MPIENIALKITLQPTHIRPGDMVEVIVTSSLTPQELNQRLLTLTFDHGWRGNLYQDRTGLNSCWLTTYLGPGVYRITAKTSDARSTVVGARADLVISPSLKLE